MSLILGNQFVIPAVAPHDRRSSRSAVGRLHSHHHRLPHNPVTQMQDNMIAILRTKRGGYLSAGARSQLIVASSTNAIQPTHIAATTPRLLNLTFRPRQLTEFDLREESHFRLRPHPCPPNHWSIAATASRTATSSASSTTAATGQSSIVSRDMILFHSYSAPECKAWCRSTFGESRQPTQTAGDLDAVRPAHRSATTASRTSR